ncbi:hypothetical protein ACFQ7F_09065 [Streptomyces sp. NPDC056486]|uniref:hypothetical protein n=1 Tax=Streptomyces sp. NPDC056486 TaxID=3345835 RepID=UPI0036BE0EB1
MVEAFVSGDGRRACGICPSRRFPLGEFDVAERPSHDFPFDPRDGHRYTRRGVPVCVHPEKVGIPPAPYKTDGVALLTGVELPDDVTELDGYLRELVHGAAPDALERLIDLADREIRRAFPEVDATLALRRAFNWRS